MRTIFKNIALHYLSMQSHPDPASGVQTRDVRLFSTQDSVMAVDSPIKLRILELAAAGPVPFDRIVEGTGKAKSTISVHLRDLERSGLITSSPDPRDSRKRLIALSSDAIGRLTNTDRDARLPPPAHRHSGTGQPFADDDIVSFFRYCVLVFRTQAMVMGINIDPVLQRTGAEVGRVLAPKVAGRTTEEVVRKMDTFWQAHSLGAISIVSSDPLTLGVRGCFECEDLPVTGHGACAFDTGVLTSIFSHHLGCPVTVVEAECYSSGDDRCIFVITPRQSKD
ncbi:V4R domain-containing protein [Methanoregula sp.]|uniref:V4R domain-containing protein n=1 Tax=Methanoregula sp. TaxID=2052170 RepID=UPI003567EF9F